MTQNGVSRVCNFFMRGQISLDRWKCCRVWYAIVISDICFDENERAKSAKCHQNCTAWPDTKARKISHSSVILPSEPTHHSRQKSPKALRSLRNCQGYYKCWCWKWNQAQSVTDLWYSRLIFSALHWNWTVTCSTNKKISERQRFKGTVHPKMKI